MSVHEATWMIMAIDVGSMSLRAVGVLCGYVVNCAAQGMIRIDRIRFPSQYQYRIACETHFDKRNSVRKPSYEPRYFCLWLDRGSSCRCFILDLNLGFTLRISLDYANAGDFTWLKLEKSKKKQEKASYNQVKIKRKVSSNRDSFRFFVLPVVLSWLTPTAHSRNHWALPTVHHRLPTHRHHQSSLKSCLDTLHVFDWSIILACIDLFECRSIERHATRPQNQCWSIA